MNLKPKDIEDIVKISIEHYRTGRFPEEKSRIHTSKPIDFSKIPVPNYADKKFIKDYTGSLKEGILNTYDVTVTKRFVCSQCGLKENQFNIVYRDCDGVVVPLISIVVPLPTTEEYLNTINQKLYTCGYNSCFRPQYEATTNAIILIFEPCHGKDAAKKILKENHSGRNRKNGPLKQ